MEFRRTGIRCLSSFVDKFSFVEKHRLYGSELVIDGDSISQQLYKIHLDANTCNQNDCYQGDYDVFEDYVDSFFEMLTKCEIISYVVFEGGVRSKQSKLNKASDRLHLIKDITNILLDEDNENDIEEVYIPLLMRDVFENTVKKRKIPMVRCDFESYPTVVSVAKSLKCPVLSYDSDYFICTEISYIPFQTLCQCADKPYPHSFRNILGSNKHDGFFIPCSKFDLTRFLENFRLTGDKLPLLAVMLGPDNSEYPNYKCLWPVIPNYQERIVKVAAWISSRTTQTAVEEFSNHAKSRISQMKLQQKLESFRCLRSKYLANLGISSNENLPENVREIENDRLVSAIPDIFLENFRKCRYSPHLMDMYVQNRYYGLKPQMENLNMPHTHICSENIVSAIHKILTNSPKILSCFVREGDIIVKKEIPLCELDVPSFTKSQDMDEDTRKSVILKILGLDSMKDALQEFPDSWQLFVATLLYLQKHSSLTLPLCYAAVLCKIILSYVDSKNNRLFRMYDKRFNHNSTSKRKSNLSSPKKDESQYIVQISKEMINFMKYFHNSRGVTLTFNANRLHIISQFQSCLFHIKLLNDLLNMPFAKNEISDCFNGSFIYNFSSALQRSSNIEELINVTWKKKAPQLIDEFQKIVRKMDLKNLKKLI